MYTRAIFVFFIVVRFDNLQIESEIDGLFFFLSLVNLNLVKKNLMTRRKFFYSYCLHVELLTVTDLENALASGEKL